MAWKHMNEQNIIKLLQLLNAEFGTKVDKVEGLGLSKNNFTDELLAKLNGIEAGANKYTHATHTAQTLGLWKVQIDAEGHVASVQAVAKEDITGLGIPGQDTTYVVATQDADGLMAAADKKKLDGIEEGANRYVHPDLTAHAQGFYKITVDGQGHVSAVAAVTKSDLAGLIGNASTTEDGLMSSADFTKLFGIEAGAQVNKLEKILVNGEEQEITDKSVDIAVPTGALAGKNLVAETDLEDSLKQKILASSEGNHGHTNKAELDKIVEGDKAKWDAAAEKAHTHTFNEAELNNVQTGDVAKWNAAQANAEATAAAALAGAKQELEGKITAEAERADAAEKANKALIDANAAAITSGDAATLKSAQEYADQKIAAQISSAYKASGTIAYEELPEASAETLGNVYNISNDFTTDADFVEGAGKAYKAGVNVAIVEVDGAYKYDVMAMSFDGFVQEADITEFTNDEIQAMWDGVFGA